MTTVQPQNADIRESRSVMYLAASGTKADLDVVPGYPVCWDISQPYTPAADTFDDLVLGRVVIKPATANLKAFAGVVKAVGPRLNPTSTTEWSRWIDLWIPRRGDMWNMLLHVNATAVVTELGCINAQWYLGSGTGYAIVALAIANA